MGGTADRVTAGKFSVGGAASLEESYGADNSEPSARQKVMVSSEYVRLQVGQRFMLVHGPGAVVDPFSDLSVLIANLQREA